MMKKYLIYILTALSVLWSVDAFAAVHYVNPAKANNGDGTTWESASGAGATGAYNAVPATLTRGDTYYISEGTYPALVLDDAVDGTQYIYIKKCGTADEVCTAAAGYVSTDHDDPAIFTTASGDTINIKTSYYEIDGVTGGGPTSWTSGHGIKITSTDTTETIGTLVRITHNGNGTAVAGHIRILHAELAHVGSEYNSEGNNCYGAWAVMNAPTGGTLSDGGHYLGYSYLHDSPVMLAWGWRPGSFTMEYNYFKRSSSLEGESTVQGSGITTYGGQDQVYRYNIFENIVGSCGVCLYTWHGDYEVNNIQFYGNVFFYSEAFRDEGTRATYTNGIQNGWIANDSGSEYTENVKAYNNTFSNLNGLKLAAILGTTSVAGNEFKNNIAYNCLGVPRSSGELNNFTLSNNWFYANKDYRNLATNLDSGWVSTGENNVLGDAMPFTSEFSDFSLTAASTAINAGADLGETYNADILGVARPQGAAWDIGAYEYPAGGGTDHTITVSVASGNGTVSPDVDQLVADGADGPVITATPANGWKVTWSGTGGCTGNGTTCQVLTVTGDVTVVATFTEIKLMPW